MLILMLMLAALDQTVVATALPSIAADLAGATGAARLSWVFSAYLMAATVAVPMYGKLADLHGTRPVLLVAVGLFLAGSVLCGISPTMDALVLSRGLQGAGGGGLLTLAMTAVVRHYPPASRGKLQGLLGAVYGLSTMVGPLVGGFLVQHLSWRWAFFINLPAGLLAMGVLSLCFPKPAAARRGAMDHPGALLLAAALVCVLLGTRHAEAPLAAAAAAAGAAVDAAAGAAAAAAAGAAMASAAKPWPAAWFLAAGGVLVAAFTAVQARSAHPLLPLSLFGRPGFAAAVGLSMASGFSLLAVVVYLPQYFQTVRGLSPSSSGLHLMPLMAGITLGSMACGRWLQRTGQVRQVALAGCAITALAFGALGGVVWAPGLPLALVSACLLPLGLGIGALFPLVTVVVQGAAPLALLGIATASPVMFRSVAGAVGVALLATVFARAGGAALVFWLAGGATLLAALAARSMPVVMAAPTTPQRPAAG